MMKRFIGVLAVLTLCSMPCAKGQNFEDEFNAFVQQNEQVFNRFADSINRQFAEAMEANMRLFESEMPKVRDPKPKPVKLPEAENKDVPKELPTIPKPVPTGNQDPAPSSANPNSVPSENLNWLDFELFGENLRYANTPFPAKLKSESPKDVSDFWMLLSDCDYKTMLETCMDARSDKGFNDWATYQLVLEMARQKYPYQFDEQAVMAVFLLNQLGMEAKIGFGNAHLFCLLAVEQQLYGVSFTDIAKRRYYIFEMNPAFMNRKEAMSFRTYDIAFPKPTHTLDMNVARPLSSASFNIVDTAILFSLNMIELFKTYPQVDMDVYANAHPSEEFCKSVERVFLPYLRTQTPVEAVGFLLAYLQYGFAYETDEEQFGFEKPFFCEENYYYEKNDCEDRAVLFSFLVRYLLGMDVVLVDYPGHLAAAVHFDEELSGASLTYKGKRYMICDPTYIGAPIGVEMPEFSPKDRTVIPLKRIR